ncbi:hypothetical protein B0H11DRAFT_2001129, partial [Mycena galericulata]
MHHQDFDQELPLECDDEYWDLPEPHSFKQPKETPSVIGYFNCYAKILEIQAAVATTLYSPRKPNDFCGREFPPTNSQTITSFDSALNSWLSQIPDHLRWDPERKDRLHFNQSALLHTAYYNVQILLHRPFIPAPLETSPPNPLPSLAICTTAARSCARIFEVYSRRGIPLKYNHLPPIFTAAVVLVLTAWCGRRSEQHLVFKCLEVLTEAETRYLAAGRLSDILIRLIHAGDSIDQLFQTHEQVPSAPSSAQAGYGPGPSASPLAQHGLNVSFLRFFKFRYHYVSVQPEPAAQWESAFTRHSMEEFETPFRVRPDNANSYRAEEGSVPVPRDAYAPVHLNAVYDFEQLMNMDLSSSSADMPVDPDAMSMWLTAPASF